MIEQVFFQVGFVDRDIVGEVFEQAQKECSDKQSSFVEVEEFKNSDTRLSVMWNSNRVKAFVIETRTGFNDIIFIKGILPNN